MNDVLPTEGAGRASFQTHQAQEQWTETVVRFLAAAGVPAERELGDRLADLYDRDFEPIEAAFQVAEEVSA